MLPARKSYLLTLKGYGLYGDVYTYTFETFTPDNYLSTKDSVEHLLANCSTRGEPIIRVVVDVRM